MPDACNPADLLYYAAGDIRSEWRALIKRDEKALEGSWEVMPARSDQIDDLMSALGFGMLKRRVVKNYKSRVDIDCSNCYETKLVTHLPMGMTKQGVVGHDGNSFQQDDPDTGCVWTNESLRLDGRLLQKRTSKLGTMYDVRCVFDSDPECKCDERPIKLFRWTFIDNNNRVFAANRWSRRIQ